MGREIKVNGSRKKRHQTRRVESSFALTGTKVAKVDIEKFRKLSISYEGNSKEDFVYSAVESAENGLKLEKKMQDIVKLVD